MRAAPVTPEQQTKPGLIAGRVKMIGACILMTNAIMWAMLAAKGIPMVYLNSGRLFKSSEGEAPGINDWMRDKILYSGGLSLRMPHGYGVMCSVSVISGSITTYQGRWKYGRYHGYGTLRHTGSSHSSEHKGFFKNGAEHGIGMMDCLGSKHFGFWKDGDFWKGGGKSE